MKIREEYRNDFTAEELMEDLVQEILKGEYTDLENLKDANEEYFTDLTEAEENILEDAFTEYEDAQEEKAELEEREQEILEREWKLERMAMEREYWTARVA